MKKTFKKVLSVVLSLAMVATSVTVYNTTTKADGDSFTEMVTDSQKNLALGATHILGCVVSPETGGADSSVTNGVISGTDYVTASKNKAGSYHIIDLGKEYNADSIENIVVWYRSGIGGTWPENGGCRIEYSRYDTEYTTVSEMTQEEFNAQRTSQEGAPFSIVSDVSDAASKMPVVRYVRVYYPNAVAYGAQVTEIGVFDVDGDATIADPETDLPEEAASVEVVSEDYNTITVTIEGNPAHPEYKYNILMDRMRQYSGVEAGTYTISKVEAGTRMIRVRSVDADGKRSMGIQKNVEVKDVSEMIEDLVLGTKNIAATKNNPASEIVFVTDFYNEDYTLETAKVALDGNIATGEGADKALRTKGTPVDVVIDLGDNYKPSEFDRVLLGYSNPRTYAASTKVAFSADNVEYTEVASTTGYTPTKDNAATADFNIVKLDNISNYENNAVRYVKITLADGAAGWGYVINEIAVALNVDVKDATIVQEKEVEEPAGVTVSSDDYNTITVNVEANTAHPEYKYNILLDGVRVLQNVEAGIHTLTDIEAGTHVIKVRAVDEEGNVSPGIESEAIVVEDAPEAAPPEHDIAKVDTSSWKTLEAKKDSIVENIYSVNTAHGLSEGVWWGIYAPHSNADYHGERDKCMLGESAAFVFQQRDVKEIWVNGKKYENPSTAFNNQGDCAEISIDVFTEEQNVITLVLNDGTMNTFAIKVDVPLAPLEPDATEKVADTTINPDTITEWIELDADKSVSLNGSKVYVSSMEGMGNAGLRGFHNEGTPDWNRVGTAFEKLPVFGFVTTGGNATSVIIGDTEYVNAKDVRNTQVYVGNDCVYINQALVEAQEDETKYFTITAVGSDVAPFVIKVVGPEKVVEPEFNVTVDGEVVEIVDGKVTLGDAEYGYFCNGKMYAPNTAVEVTEDMAFTAVNELTVTMANGAGIRYAGTAGIRFQSSITSDNMDAVASDAITEGTLITANDIYEAKGTPLTLTSDYTKIDVKNSGWYNGTVGTYCGSICDVVESNYIRNFTARAYVTVNYENAD
ncbi:MAG: DUF1533 domain-containing protein, partial [Eubacterium sp.]|nr:DUF1533 domain-containing protein [Eubacterium sp.]